jgi:glycosyltransferase involved in cell wall biosynthesis
MRVLYLASNSFMRNLYEALKDEHPDVEFVQERGFKADVERLTGYAEFLMYLVDDDIFTQDFSVQEVTTALDSHSDAIGFSLRLGRNTTYCYTLDRDQPLPEFTELSPGRILGFEWTKGTADFGYPLEVASSIYRGADLIPLVRSLRYRNPNTFEARLATSAGRFASSHPRLLSFATSAAFCVPVNLVQTVNDNRVGNRPDLSVEALARAFYDGFRLRPSAYSGFVPKAAHQEVELELERSGPARPRVSVVIPCYMQAEYLRQAVDSVVAQTFEDWELVIVNDGSTDATSQIAREAIERYPDRQVRLVETPNQGLPRARNAGIEASRGWMIQPLDADDILHPSMLDRTVTALEKDWTSAIAYTDLYHFGSEDRLVRAHHYNFERLCFRNQLSYCSLYRRHAWQDAGGYNPNMEWGYEDWDFWVGCGQHHAAGTRIAEPLFFYRVRPDSMFSNALEHDHELRRRLRANHPELFTATPRLLRPVKIVPAVLGSRLGSMMAGARRVARTLRRSASGGRSSISDTAAYTDFCQRASESEAVFRTFRADPTYTLVLEHVTERQGREYIDVIERDNPQLLLEVERFRTSDQFGSPRVHEYPGIGTISPTTLRYVKVLSDLMKLFGDLTDMRIIEIGVGYGGQAKVITDKFRVGSYTLVDLDAPLNLARRFLASSGVEGLEFRTTDQLDPSRQYDLVISNYAFSELSREIQDEYLARIVRRARSGYMTVNFISQEHNIKSYSRSELLGLAPNIVLHAEEPLTHPDNLIVTWKG